MKIHQLLFLDFDGVLRLSEDRTVPRHISVLRLEKFLLERPEIKVVFSTAWRNLRSFETLVSVFPPSIQSRFIGFTGTIEKKFEGSREVEIANYLWEYMAQNPEVEKVAWIALDDSEKLFSINCPNLIHIYHFRASYLHDEDLIKAGDVMDRQLALKTKLNLKALT